MDAQPEAARGRLRAALRSEVVNVSTLVRMDFASEAIHWSDRLIGFTDANGQHWEGMGEIVQITQVSGGTDNLASFLTYTIGFHVADLASGATARVPEILGNESEYLKREASVLQQFFDDQGPIGVPVVFDTGLMYSPSMSVDRETMTLSIRAENPLLNKRRPRHGNLTAKSQEARAPGDKGLDYVPNAATEAKNWLV